MKLTNYDKSRLMKWRNMYAWEFIQNGCNINPYLKATNLMIKEAASVAKDLGGEVTTAQVVSFLNSEGAK